MLQTLLHTNPSHQDEPFQSFERITHTAHIRQILHHVLSVLTVVVQYLKTWGQIFYSNHTNLGIVLFLWVFWS